MSLIEDIEKLRDDSVAALDASHNYFTHTKTAWRLVQQFVRQGRQITIRNQETGSVVREPDLPGLAQEYITGYLAEATFQHFVSLFEDFIGDFLRLWLNEFPESLSAKKLDFDVVLQCSDKVDIVRSVVDKQVASLQYDRVPKWFDYIQGIVDLGCPTADEIERVAEVKASRDVLVHNKGIANAIYVDKSMGRARLAVGEKVDVPEHYHRESWQLVKKVITDVSNAGMSRLQP